MSRFDYKQWRKNIGNLYTCSFVVFVFLKMEVLEMELFFKLTKFWRGRNWIEVHRCEYKMGDVWEIGWRSSLTPCHMGSIANQRKSLKWKCDTITFTMWNLEFRPFFYDLHFLSGCRENVYVCIVIIVSVYRVCSNPSYYQRPNHYPHYA